MDPTSEDLQAAYYARIVPVLGEGLREARIAVCGVAGVAGVIERLAGCRAVQWWIADDARLGVDHPLVHWQGTALGMAADAALAASLQAHNRWETGWAFSGRKALTSTTSGPLAAELQAAPPDLILGGGDAATLAHTARLARLLNVPALLVAHLAGGSGPQAACLTLLPGDQHQGREWLDLLRILDHPAIADPSAAFGTPSGALQWVAANGLAALIAKVILLHGTPQADPAWERLLWHERRTAAILGSPAWPWTVHHVDPATCGPYPGVGGLGLGVGVAAQPAAPATSRPVLIVGCGSLGSHAARALAASHAAQDLILVDGEQVDAANPVRQFFHTDQVGQPKAVALAHNLARLLAPAGCWTERVPDFGPGVVLTDGVRTITALTTALTTDRQGLAAFRRWLLALRPAAALLATGSQADYALARVLRSRGVPHVVGRCYPRARYFEAIVVDGQRGPCFGCLRGHLYTGPAPPPTLEEALRYDRPPSPGELQAEPATGVESGRAADVLAALVAGLARPRRARPSWLQALLLSAQTCLLGGTTVHTPTPGAPPAYGLAVPGQVVAYGLAQVLGVEGAQRCADCGRLLQTRYAV